MRLLLLIIILLLITGCAPETPVEEPTIYTSITLEHPEPEPKCTDIPPAKILQDDTNIY